MPVQRNPAGIPSGGQFASVDLDESDVDLDDDLDDDDLSVDDEIDRSIDQRDELAAFVEEHANYPYSHETQAAYDRWARAEASLTERLEDMSYVSNDEEIDHGNEATHVLSLLQREQAAGSGL